MQLIYLPTYSPDLNPIEEAFSAIKSWIQKHRDCVLGELTGAQHHDPYKMLWDAVFSVTLEKAISWFCHSGYIA
jgi:DDE superfamily endonuclease